MTSDDKKPSRPDCTFLNAEWLARIPPEARSRLRIDDLEYKPPRKHSSLKRLIAKALGNPSRD